MVDAHASNLTQYGYDCVVAVTQSSISSNMLEYFSTSTQPVVYVCWIWDDNNNLKQISLTDLKQLTGGISPFDIGPNTPITDPRVQKLLNVFFHSAYMFQPGLPPDVDPSDLPEMVVLNNSATDIKFTMYFSQFTAVQYTEAHGHSQAKWDVWSQNGANPWTIQTTVSLVTKDLDASLDTPYFNSNPIQKQNIMSQFRNISGSAFSLQQLLFDFANAPVPDTLTFPSIDSNTPLGLGSTFAKAYAGALAENGEPLISVQAVATSPETSSLHITSIDRMVNPPVDESGIPISNPSPDQQDATTLDYLCMMDKKPFKGGSTFAWNWVEPSNLGSVDGTIAISRATICNQLLAQLVPAVRPFCLVAGIDVSGSAMVYSLAQFGDPQITNINATGKDIISIQFRSDSGRKEWNEPVGKYAMRMQPAYSAQVTVEGKTLTISQTATLQLEIALTETRVAVSVQELAVARTRADVYDISVDADGNLAAVYSGTSTTQNDIKDLGSVPQQLIGDLWSQVQTAFVKTLDRIFTSVTFSSTHNFIFPGAKVFVYKDARFSDTQDLISSLTYLKATDSQFPTPPPAQVQATTAGSGPKPFNVTSHLEPVKQLVYSTELVQNYLHAEVVPAEGKFEALQTDEGHTLLFTVSADGVLNVIEESSGVTATGWVSKDLSTTLFQNHSVGSGATVRTYDVTQSVVDGTINLAVVVKSPQSTDRDLLFHLTGSNSDTSWVQNPQWKRLAFDDPDGPSTVTISKVFFSETADGHQYLIADVDGSAIGTAKDIRRYFVDINSTEQPLWVSRGMPVNVENASYQSCVGRIPKGRFDGLYTSGSQAGSAQLVYVPMKNAFGRHGSASVTKFVLPQGTPASAIATARVGANEDARSDLYLATDLYAASGSYIYLFAAADQAASTVEKSVAVINSSLVSGTTKLLCQASVDTITLWGLTESHLVYYVSCPISQVSNPSAWSTVNIVLTDVEHLSAYVNRADGGNTIFSAGGGRLRQIVQATSTKSKLWRTHEITLATQPEQPSLPINSYTTTVQALNSSGAPAGTSTLLVSAKTRTPVHINGLYYVLKPTPVPVYTDSAGLLTVIERIDDLQGSILTVSTEDSQIDTIIHPFDVPFSRLTELDSADKLKKALMPINLKAGGFVGEPEYRPLVQASMPPEKLDAIATNLGIAQQVYTELNNPSKPIVIQASGIVTLSIWDDIANAVETTAGDLIQSIKTAWNEDIVPALQYIEAEISKGWHMFVQIGGQVFHAVMHGIEDVVAAAIEMARKAAKKAQDWLDYLKVLFNWNDITRTKDVISKITNAWMEDKVQDIRNFRTYIDENITDVEKELLQLAQITDWTIPGDTMLASPPSAGSNNPQQGQTSSSSLLARHYRNHAEDSKFKSDSPLSGITDDPTLQGLVKILSDTANAEANTIGSTFTEIQNLCQSFATMPVQQFFIKLLAILGVAVLDSVRNVIDALLDILVLLAELIIQELNRKIHIPILSHILNELGIPDFSILDIFFYILSAFFTIPYKIAHHDKPPFPDNDDTRKILDAGNWNELTTLFGQTSPFQNASADIATMSIVPSLSKETSTVVNFLCHGVVSVTEWLGDVAGLFIASAEPGEASNTAVYASALFGALSGIVGAAVDILVPKCALQSQGAKVFNGVDTVVRIFCKVAFSGPGQKIVKWADIEGMQFESGPAASVSAFVDAILTLPTIISTIIHFKELSKIKEASFDRSAAIIEEVSNIVCLVQRVAFAVASSDPEPETKTAFILIYSISGLIVGGLQCSVAFLN